MPPALLWITLIAATALLILIASPIRLSVKAAYRGDNDDISFNASACYIHPRVLRVDYSSADEGARVFIFGFRRKKRGGHDPAGDGDAPDDASNGQPQTAPTIAQGANDDTPADPAPEAGDDDAPNADAPKGRASTIKDNINALKNGRAYRIFRDKPLRRKVSRWLKRSMRRALRTVSIEKFRLRAAIGLRNPATTGMAYGYFSAVKSALALKNPSIDISMEPTFTERRFDINSDLTIRTTPSTILWQLSAIAATCPYLALRAAMRR
jgi:hypothetical protein